MKNNSVYFELWHRNGTFYIVGPDQKIPDNADYVDRCPSAFFVQAFNRKIIGDAKVVSRVNRDTQIEDTKRAIRYHQMICDG